MTGLRVSAPLRQKSDPPRVPEIVCLRGDDYMADILRGVRILPSVSGQLTLNLRPREDGVFERRPM
jgi:hypothetical protein